MIRIGIRIGIKIRIKKYFGRKRDGSSKTRCRGEGKVEMKRSGGGGEEGQRFKYEIKQSKNRLQKRSQSEYFPQAPRPNWKIG